MPIHIILVILLSLSSLTPSPPQFPYMLQPGSPVRVQSFLYPEEACNWEGIGGQVFDRNGQPVTNLVVRIYGLYNGAPLYANALTGVSQKLGPGGYEYKLGSKPATPTASLTVQVFSLTGEALSYPVVVTTGGICDSNLTLVNFREVTSLYDRIFPLINQ